MIATIAHTAYRLLWSDLCWKSRVTLAIFLTVIVLGLAGLRVHP